MALTQEVYAAAGNVFLLADQSSLKRQVRKKLKATLAERDGLLGASEGGQ